MWWTTTGRLMRGVWRHFFGNRAGVPDQNPAGPVVNNIPLQPVAVADGGADGAPAWNDWQPDQGVRKPDTSQLFEQKLKYKLNDWLFLT